MGTLTPPFTVEAFDASEPGALAGWSVACTCCPTRLSTSLSAREANRLGWQHADWHERTTAGRRNVHRRR